MRIAVDFRMLSGGANVVNRGTGRYTQQQIRAVLEHDSDNEYVLICHADADEALILPEIRQAPNVTVRRLTLPGFKSEAQPNQPANALRLIAQFQDWLYEQRVDLYHEATPYQVDELVLSHFDVCPLIATVYDLIPAVYPHYYWPPGKRYHEELGRALHVMATADRLIAISESARRDVCHYLGVPRERVDLAYPIADPLFRPLPGAEVTQALQNLRARHAIPDSFVMSLTHLHHTKNLNTLLAAYARLPQALRKQAPLVAVFFLGEGDQEELQRRTTAYGIREDVILTGLVSETELVALYNAATMVVHPSRYEGFGYPVVEAMQCGTPVITTTAASLPEAGGDAAVLVDPDDVQGMADAMRELFENCPRREQMRHLGLEHIQRFNAEQLAQNTLAGYRQALVPAQPPDSRPHLALWTSLPPLNCGIADYTTELLPHLAQTYRLEIFADDGYLPAPDLMRRHTIHHHSAITRRMAQQPFDVQLYQFGVSAMHDYMYAALRQNPGIVVMHDLNFAADLHYVYHSRGTLEVFEREIVAREGPEAVQAFQRVQQLRGAAQDQARQAFFQTYPLNTWVVQSSLAQIVHMAEAKRELERRSPSARAFDFPMGVAEPWSDLTARLQPVRDQLLRDPDTFVVGVFGSVARLKRLESCIQAFRQLLNREPKSLLVIVGELMDTAYAHQLKHLANALGIADKVTFLGRTSLEVFHHWLLACDVVLNLRYPPKLQMSAVLCRAIAAGKPVIVTDLPEWRFFPESFCWRVAPNEHEVATIADYLCRLATDVELRQERGRQARAYYESVGTVAHMAANYRAVIEAVAATPPTLPVAASAPSQGDRPLNKVCEVEDFADPRLAAVIQEVFAHEAFARAGGQRREYWEAAMMVEALRRHHQLHLQARILSLNAAAHPLNYYLTRHVQQVFAIDRYLHRDNFQRAVLAAPDQFAPYAAMAERLIVQHMDSRWLRFADNAFEAVVTCRPLREAGDLESMAHTAYEVGRVLKPGGLASFIVEYALSAPPGESGWDPHKPIVSLAQIERYVVEASGLELVEPLQPIPSAATLTRPRHLTLRPDEYERAESRPAQLVYTVGGYVICALHLALRKAETYPVGPNAWAKPTEQTRALIRREALMAARARADIVSPEAPRASVNAAPRATLLQLLRRLVGERTLVGIRAGYGALLKRLPPGLAGTVHKLAYRSGLVERL